MDFKEEFTNPKDVTDTYAPEDIAAHKGIAIAASIPILFWLPLVAAKDSGYAKFYANQGLTLFVLEAAAIIIRMILRLVPFVGGFVGNLIYTVVVLAVFVGLCWLIYQAVNGKAKYLPLVGEYLTPFK